MTLTAYQFTYNSLSFGAGTEIGASQMDGMRGYLARTGDQPKMLSPGNYLGFDVPGGRTLTFTLKVQGTSDNDFETQLNAVETAFTPQLNSDLPLSFQLPGQAQNRRINCRCARRALLMVPEYMIHYAEYLVELHAIDPRIYDDTLTTTSTPSTLTNSGNFESRPIIVYTAGVPGTITNTTTGDTVVIRTPPNPPGGTIPASLTIRCFGRTCVDTSNGTNRYDCIDPATTWITLAPGANVITGSGSFQFRSAWL